MKILITGGGGDIAASIAMLLQKSGHIVLNPNRNELDVCNEDAVSSYMAQEEPDILINCAGYIAPQAISECNINIVKKHFDVNIIGAIICSKYAIRNGCRIIINIGSTSSFEGKAEWGAYCASKASLISLTETLAREGVDCYSVNPGRTKTKMRKSLFPSEDESTLMSTERLAEFVLRALNKEFSSGSHIIVLKKNYFIIPSRNCPK